MNLNNLEKSIKSLEEEVSTLKGKVSVLEEQFHESTEKLSSLKENQIINAKAIEILTLVQKSTTELTKEIFEGVVTKALQYIHDNNEYKFELEFSRHGNTPKMRFLLKTPDMQESHDILNCRAGGSKDIIALALRLVLLELSRNKGFLFFDEPYKRLDNEKTIQKAIEFVKETQKDTDRQIFIITHKQEVVDSVSNPIIIKSNSSKTESKISDDIKPKRKRGRPRKKESK